MLTRERAIQLFIHDRADVRSLAAAFFLEGATVEPLRFRDIQPALLAADDLSRWQLLGLAARLELDDAAGACLLEVVKVRPSVVDGHAFLEASAALPWSSRAALLERVGAGPLRARMERLSELEQLGFDELWARLSDLAVEADRTVYVDRIDHALKKDLIRQLLRRDPGDLADRAAAWLDDSEDAFFMSLFALEILSQRPNPRVLPRLLELIDEDDDYHSHLAAEALGSIADASVADLLERAREDNDARQHYHEALGRMRTPQAEQALIELYRTEDNSDWRTQIGCLLCESLTTDALPELVQSCVTGDYEPLWAELDIKVDAACAAAGYADAATEALAAQAAETRREKEAQYRAARAKPAATRSAWVSRSKKSKERRQRDKKRAGRA